MQLEAGVKGLDILEQDIYFGVDFITIALNYFVWKYTYDEPSGINDNIVQMRFETVMLTTV